MKKMLSLILCACVIVAALYAAVIAEEAVSSPAIKQPVIQIVIKPTSTAKPDDPTSTKEPAKEGADMPAEEPVVNLVIREVEVEKMPESTAKLFQQLQQMMVLPVMPSVTAAPAATPAASPAGTLSPLASVTPAPGTTVTPEPSATVTPEATVEPAPMKVDITAIVPEDTVKQIVERLPQTSKVEDLVVTEFIPMTVANYDTTIGDVQAQVVTAVKYKPEETVTPLLGVWNGKEMVWFVPEVMIGEDGSLFLNFTAEMLAMMQDSEPVLMILSDLQAQVEASAQPEITPVPENTAAPESTDAPQTTIQPENEQAEGIEVSAMMIEEVFEMVGEQEESETL